MTTDDPGGYVTELLLNATAGLQGTNNDGRPAEINTATGAPIVLSPPKEILGLSVETFSYILLIIGGAAPVIFLIIVYISLKCHMYRKLQRQRAGGGMTTFVRGHGGPGDRRHVDKEAYYSGGGHHIKHNGGYYDNGGYAMANGNALKPASLKREQSIKSISAYGIKSYGEPAYGEGFRVSNNNPNVYFGTVNRGAPPQRAMTHGDRNGVSYSPSGGGGVVAPTSPMPSVSGRVLQHSVSITSQERSALAAFDSIYEGLDTSGGSNSVTYDMVYGNGGIHPMPGVVQNTSATSVNHSHGIQHSTNTRDTAIQASSGPGHQATRQRNGQSDLYAVPQRPTTVSHGTQTSLDDEDSDYDAPPLPPPPPPEELIQDHEHQHNRPESISSHDSSSVATHPVPQSEPASSIYGDSSVIGSDTSHGRASYNLLTHTPSSDGSHTETSGVIYNSSANGISTHELTIHNTSVQSRTISENRVNTTSESRVNTTSSTTIHDSTLLDNSHNTIHDTSAYTSATSLSAESHVTRASHESRETAVVQSTPSTLHRHDVTNSKAIIDDDDQLFIMAGIRPPSPFSVDNIAYVPE